uniref:Uncharacterized protein n=1 Tax=Cannabis sativa TaxID=3483 RepID=A0A803QNA4_CANSA
MVMASSSTVVSDLEECHSKIQLEEEEEGALLCDLVEDVGQSIDERWCLVGKFLTSRVIDSLSMQHTLASLWQPGKGMFVKELQTNLYLFQFYHEADIQRVIEGSPWTFNKFQLVFERLKKGEDPMLVKLCRLDIWVQLHNLRPGFMFDSVVQRVANYIGTYVKSDPKNFNGVWRNYLRVRVSINVEKPLKRRMKLKKEDGDWLWTNFKYEFIPTFCFICGIIGHSERFCSRLYETPLELIEKPYGIWMKAEPQRKNKLIRARWLRTGTAADAQFFDDGANAINDHVITSTRNQGLNGINIDSGADFVLNSRNQGTIINKENATDQGITAISVQKVRIEDNFQSKSMILIDCKRRRTDDDGKEVMEEDELEVINNDLAGSKNGSMDLVVQKRPNFVFLCETLCKKDKVDRLRVQLKFDGAISADAQGRSGVIDLLWRNKDDVTLLRYTHDYIDVQVNAADGITWRLTGCYGEPNRSLRAQTWNMLRTLSADNTLPWCVIGDINNVLAHDDKKGGTPYPSWLIEGFNQALTDCGLCDLNLSGYPYTWEKGRGSSNWIEVRLDRALVFDSWLNIFNSAKLLNLEVSSSDHCPILLEPTVRNYNTEVKHFRFENSWLREPMCIQTVKDSWEVGNSLEIMDKIALCSRHLTEWGKNYTGNFKQRILYWKKQVAHYKSGRDDNSISAFIEAEKELFEVNKSKTKQCYCSAAKFSRKSIAKGFETSILEDPWLLDATDPFVRTSPPGLVNHKVLCYNIIPASHQFFHEWFQDVMKDNNPTQIEEALMVTWAIWNARNKLLWNQKSTLALDVVLSARSNLYQWQSAQHHRFDPLISRFEIGKEEEHWTKPGANMVKINVDGVIFEAYNSYGFGIIARDSSGCIIENVTSCRSGSTSPEIVELIGIKEALSWIKTKGWTFTILETVCLMAVQAIHNNCFIPSTFGMLVHDCQHLLSELSNVTLSFVKRSANKAAHFLARIILCQIALLMLEIYLLSW